VRTIETIRFAKSKSVKASATALLALALTACGGGSSSGGAAESTATGDVTPPTAVLSQAGPALTANAMIVIRFSESMNPASLQLSGTLTSESNGGVWSKTNTDNDTLTLSPKPGGWATGPDRTLNVDAKDLAGNALATLKPNYAVKLAFDNFQAAAVAIGQADFAGGFANQGGAGANTLASPFTSPTITGAGALFISDFSNNRVLGYNSVPTTSNANADFVLGQPNFSATGGPPTSQGSHDGPKQLFALDGKLVVLDSSNRVVIYNSVPTSGAALPSVVVGQADFNSSGSACDDSSLLDPEGIAITPGGKLVVADTGHHRVLIWNTLPTSPHQPANVVLGQGNFINCAANDVDQNGTSDGVPTAETLDGPTGVWTDGTRLIVSDSGNSRVLIWNQLPSMVFEPADVVLGQYKFTRHAFNDDNQDGAPDAPTARTFRGPRGITFNGVQLAIADSENNRVLIWNTFPATNFKPADVVLGQNDFSHHEKNDTDQNGSADANPSANTLGLPTGVLFYRNKLLVTDTSNSRVLIYQSK
jgi:hypothetical protein